MIKSLLPNDQLFGLKKQRATKIMQGVAQESYSQASLRVQPKGQIETPITRLTRVCMEKSRRSVIEMM